jgi:hypothetical protein
VELLISCRETTYLISRNREKSIGPHARLRLVIHLLVCEYCGRFRKQTRFLEYAVKKVKSDQRLTDEEKRQIERDLESGGARDI